jgi:hypothetical protein
VHGSGNNTRSKYTLTVHASDSKSAITVEGFTNEPLLFSITDVELWSPETPSLYNVTIELGDDTVESYMAFRTVSRGVIDGVQRPLLNGEFIFQFSTLDQGFWPDGLYSPPSLDAMLFDLEVLKDTGFNMVRKHVSTF